MKQRFTFLDLRAVVNEIKPRLIGKFIQNFYSTSQRIIFIKFSNKDILLVEPGIRMHLTKDSDSGISHFCNILRKRARRDKVVNIYQAGFDRVVVFELTRQKIVFEFFSGGNIFILENDTVVDVFRVVKELDIIKNSLYVFNNVKFDFSFENFLNNDLHNFLPFEEILTNNLLDKINSKISGSILEIKERILSDPEKNLEGDILSLKIDDKKSLTKDSSIIRIFNECMQEFENYIESIQGFGGIITKKNKKENLVPYDINVNIKFDSFNDAAEEFFSERKKTNKKDKNEGKEEKIRNKQLQHIRELEIIANDMLHKSEVIEENKLLVQEILDIHTSVVKNKVKWGDFEKFKEYEDKKGNPASLAIVKSDFKNKTAIIKINEDFLELDFDVSIYNNINNYHDKRKKLLEKIEKTKYAIENIKIKTYRKEETKKLQRNVFWFEKFNFCFSSDGNLIFGGKNSQQNEIIVKKHLNDKDLYFHTDASGSSSVVLKQATDTAIEEAALVALCLSKCWSTNVVSPVWYVYGDQVSKTPPTGQYLAKGSFLIKGTKNYIDCYKLEYGLGLLFKLVDTYEYNEDEFCIKYDGSTFVIDPKDHEIEFAFPVCGPWKVIKDYKYRTRILLGKDKKGKVIQEIIKTFVKQSDEKDVKLIKSITVEEFMNVLPSNIKIGKFK